MVRTKTKILFAFTCTMFLDKQNVTNFTMKLRQNSNVLQGCLSLTLSTRNLILVSLAQSVEQRTIVFIRSRVCAPAVATKRLRDDSIGRIYVCANIYFALPRRVAFILFQYLSEYG